MGRQFYANFAPSSSIAGIYFSWNFSFRVNIITSRQLKCKTNRIFQSFFSLRVLYCSPNLFSHFDHLPNTVAGQSNFICYLFIFLGFKSDMIRLCNEQTKMKYTYFPKDVTVYEKSDLLIQPKISNLKSLVANLLWKYSIKVYLEKRVS